MKRDSGEYARAFSSIYHGSSQWPVSFRWDAGIIIDAALKPKSISIGIVVTGLAGVIKTGLPAGSPVMADRGNLSNRLFLGWIDACAAHVN